MSQVPRAGKSGVFYTILLKKFIEENISKIGVIIETKTKPNQTKSNQNRSDSEISSLRLQNQEITQEQYNDALTECDSIISQMGTDAEKTEIWLLDILNIVYTRIAKGLKPIENRISQSDISKIG